MSGRALEGALRAGGAKVAEGHFRVDAQSALERLKHHRFTEPSHWVLEVLRAAVASKAKHVRVRTDADDVEVGFDGEPFPQALMKDLLAQALNAGRGKDEQRTRLFALGVAGALGLEPAFVRVESGGVRLEFEAPSTILVSKVEGRATSVHLKKRLGWRVAASWLSGAPEARAIREYAYRLPAELVLDSQRVDRQRPFGPDVTAESSHALGGATLVTAPVNSASTTELELDVLGVLVSRRRLVLPGAQCVAWLRADEMKRDASGSDVVDDDPLLRAALSRLRTASLELLQRQVDDLGASSALREALLERLLDRAAPDEVRRILEGAPLLPGPSGEWLSVRALKAEVAAGRPIYFATGSYPRGTCPEKTVLLPPGSRLEPLIPSGRRADVAAIARRRERAATLRAQWASTPVEAPVLPEGRWLRRVPISTGTLKGEVGIEDKGLWPFAAGRSAGVRLLNQGRFVQMGEVASLAPLRFLAVVDDSKPLSNQQWQHLDEETLLDLVAPPVEAAVRRAILSALDEPEGWPHGRDLLLRLARSGEKQLAALPQPLLEAPLFRCCGGARASLGQLRGERKWLFTSREWDHGLLSGHPVLVLSPEELEALQAFGSERLLKADELLENEVDVRRRLNGPRRSPGVKGKLVSVPVEGEGFTGEVAIPEAPNRRLRLRLLREGVELETTELTARYALAEAEVECAALVPNPGWTGAVRDAVFTRVVKAVEASERLLAVELDSEEPLGGAATSTPSSSASSGP